MSSRKPDTLIDAMIRQALQPIAEAHAPPGVWQRIVTELETADLDRRGPLAWFKLLEGFSIGPLTQRYCVGPFGRCLPSPVIEVIGFRFRGQHIAS